MKTYTAQELKEVLDKHAEWLEDPFKGENANLRYANLSNTDLCDANLSNTNLIDADLSNSDLKGANLRYANLSNTNLCDANLSNTNLIDADLSNSDLRDADLRDANLSNANLSGTDLSNADLTGAYLYNTKIITFQAGRHFAFIHLSKAYEKGNICKIGCETMSLQDWVVNFKEVGEMGGYSKEEIELYGSILKFWAKKLRIARWSIWNILRFKGKS